MTDLSVIILNWNTKELLIDCIDSIIKSKPKVSIEVIVVDNGSTDGSVEALDRFKGKLKLTSIKNDSNLGFAKANNQGIKVSAGKYILLLNSDTLIEDEAIDKLYNFAISDKKIGVVGAKLKNRDGSTQASCFYRPTLLGAIKEYWLGIKNSYGNYVPAGENPTEVDVVAGAAFLITPQARLKVGILDEKFFFFFEDLDYCRRTWRNGLKVYYLPEAVVIHLHGSTVRKTAEADVVWKRLIPGSKLYNGILNHYLIHFVIWTSQKWKKLFSLGK